MWTAMIMMMTEHFVLFVVCCLIFEYLVLYIGNGNYKHAHKCFKQQKVESTCISNTKAKDSREESREKSIQQNQHTKNYKTVKSVRIFFFLSHRNPFDLFTNL